jgi:hypothetical protein
LHLAASGGFTDLVRLLLHHGADARATDAGGWTALHFAAERGDAELASLLCDAGAEPRTSNRVGVSPLHSAAEKDAADVVLVLLRHGAEVCAVNAVGDSPLHYAAEKGHTGAARALLSAGGDVRRPNKYGSTPLHAAASGTGEPALVDLLLRFGADPLAVDGQGQTPADVAVTDGIRDLLLGRQSFSAVNSPAAHSQQTPTHHVYDGSPPRGLSPYAAAESPATAAQEDARYEAVGEEMLSPWSPRVAGRLSTATERTAGLPAEWLPDGSTSRALPQTAAATHHAAPAAAFAGSRGGDEAQIATVTALAELQQARDGVLSALQPALEQAQAAVPVYQAAAGVAQQLRLLRMASSLRADADSTRRLAESLAQAQLLTDASRNTLVQRRAGVRTALSSAAAEPAIARAAAERDRAQAAHKATVARSAALALQLAEAQQSRAEMVTALVESAGVSDQAEAPCTADADEAAALAQAMVETAATTLAPACERTARAAQALLYALHDEAAQCAQVAEAMAQALSTACGASAAAAAAVQQETPAADASAAQVLAHAASTELACLAALEEQRAAGSAAAMQLKGIAEARLEAQLAEEELQSEARKARLRGSWPPGRQAAHAAAEQQCAAMLRAYDQDAAALSASLQGAPLELAYPEMRPRTRQQQEAGATPVNVLTRAAVEEVETLRRTERCALLRVSWLGAPGAAVALKVIPGRGGDAFVLQARRLLGLRHPLVLPVLAAFTDDNGDACILLPLQPRGSVRSVAEAHMANPPPSGELGDAAWASWRRVLRQVVQALARLHQGGLSHGAVHWDNVLWADESDDAGVVLADARGGGAGGGEEAWGSDLAAVGSLARTLSPGSSVLAELAQVCLTPGMQASVVLLHPGCGALDQVPHRPCALDTAMRALADAAAATAAGAETLRVEVGSEGSLLRDMLLAHDAADAKALARPWHITVGGTLQPACGPVTRLLAALLDPELGLFAGPDAPAGGHDGLGQPPVVLPCPDDAPPCQRAVGLPRPRALRAVGRVLAKAALCGIGTLPLELPSCGYAALLDPDAAQQQLLADPFAAVATLALWDGPAAAALAHTLACKAPVGASDAAKAATVAAGAVNQLLGCRAGGMRAMSQGFLETFAAQGDSLCSVLWAPQQPAHTLPAVLNCTAHVAVAPMVAALLWADSWPAQAPVKEHLVAWLRQASDVMRALFSVRAWGSLQPPQSLLLILPGQPGLQAATFGGDRTLVLPPRGGEEEMNRLLVASLLQL